MANGIPTWNGTDSCSDKIDLGNLGSSISQAMVQFLDYISISANQNTDVNTLKWYTTGGDWEMINYGCPVLNDLPNFYQYMTILGIQNSGLGSFQTWTELLDAVNNAGTVTTPLTPIMGWEEVQDILHDEGSADWTIFSQQENCLCVGSISGGGVTGCTNPTATNYNPLATIDDGSCVGGLLPGCCDPIATNYNPLATCNDGSCEYNGGEVYGCTHEKGPHAFGGGSPADADNYNSLATIDDGSCCWSIVVHPTRWIQYYWDYRWQPADPAFGPNFYIYFNSSKPPYLPGYSVNETLPWTLDLVDPNGNSVSSLIIDSSNIANYTSPEQVGIPSFNWVNTIVFSNLTVVGTYVLTVTMANGCVDIKEFSQDGFSW